MTVVAVGRDAHRLETVAEEIETAGGTAIPEACDLADLEQTADLARRVAARLDHIDVLIHNAGALLANRTLTPQGQEVTVAVHLLSPHLLTALLRPQLAAADRAKVLTMTSGGMYTEAFDLSRLTSDDDYRGTVAYARAKRAQVVWTIALQAREPTGGLDFSLVHPGWARTPGVSSSLPGFSRLLGPLLRTQGTLRVGSSGSTVRRARSIGSARLGSPLESSPSKVMPCSHGSMRRRRRSDERVASSPGGPSWLTLTQPRARDPASMCSVRRGWRSGSSCSTT